jgi:hypothetical protein
VEEDKRWIADSDNTIAAQAARKPPAPYKSKQKVYDSTKTREMNQPCWQEHGNDGFFVKNINLSPWALDVTAYTLNNKVSHLLISFHRNAYERVLLTFKERYGTPTGSRTEIWRSQIGATFNNQITNWDGRRLSIMLAQIGTVTVDHGLITYDTAEWQAESARRLKEEIKKAAKGL